MMNTPTHPDLLGHQLQSGDLVAVAFHLGQSNSRLRYGLVLSTSFDVSKGSCPIDIPKCTLLIHHYSDYAQGERLQVKTLRDSRNRILKLDLHQIPQNIIEMLIKGQQEHA